MQTAKMLLGCFSTLLAHLLWSMCCIRVDGYVLQILRNSRLEACVSDEASVAFGKEGGHVEKADVKNTEVLDLNGNAGPINKYDCNLVREGGCENWSRSDWKEEPNLKNNFDPYPRVADYRWDDLPNFSWNGEFNEKIVVSKKHTYKSHFSILASDSAQFLFVNDSKSKSGYSVVIDGWEKEHKSVLRYCKSIPARLECDVLHSITGKNILQQGDTWSHITATISIGNQNNFSLQLGDINYVQRNVKQSELKYAVSCRTNKGGLFKLHKYNVIRPENATSAMEVQLMEDTKSDFCVDVVYLLTGKFPAGTTAFELRILDGKKEAKFEAKAAEAFTWITKRFYSAGITLKNGWKLRLTARVANLVIGGVKFCRPGDLVIKPTILDATNCHSLLDSETTIAPSHFDELLYKLGECRVFGHRCFGYQLCARRGEYNKCTCFAGFSGNTCKNKCPKERFGTNCSRSSKKICFDNKLDHVHGTCLEGCAKGVTAPMCENEIQKAKPVTERISFNSATLDLAASLNGTVNVSTILIQFKQMSQPGSRWLNFSGGLIPATRRVCTIRGLQPKSNYGIKFVLFEKDAEKYPHNYLPGQALTITTPCKPIVTSDISIKSVNKSTWWISLEDAKAQSICTPTLITVANKETGTLLNESLKGINNFKVNFSMECKCGDAFYVSIHFEESQILKLIHDCATCLSLTIGFVILVLTPFNIILVAVGIWLGYKFFWKKRLPREEAAVLFKRSDDSTASIEDRSQLGSVSYEIAFDSEQVKQYLLSALSENTIKELFQEIPLGQTQPWEHGTKPQNRSKNRYADLAAYDSTRVKLELLPGDHNSDYINANYVDGFQLPKAYIASQGPMANTIEDFWRMVWQENVSLIVMVTNLVENNKKKCEKYWPDAKQEERYGCFTVANEKEEINAYFVSRFLVLHLNSTERKVRQLHYTNWPSNGVPLYPQSVALFLRKIEPHRSENPILVHCSAGVGRTGAVILIDASFRMLRSQGRLDIVNLLTQMRSQRVNLVNHWEKFEFVYLVLFESIFNSEFEVSCQNFASFYNSLMLNNCRALLEDFEKINKICKRDFERAEKPAEIDIEKSRYPDLIAASSAIVWLFPYGDVTCMNFINAVFVDGYQRAQQFIATQVPMKNTVWDFWRMIDQFNVKQIIVLSNPYFSHENFLPLKKQSLDYGEIEVILDETLQDNTVTKSFVKLMARGICKKVSVICPSLGWMPGEVKTNLESLIDLWESLKSANEKEIITVCCHDGVTASGLFLGIGFTIEKIKMEHKVDVALAVRTLRKSRPAFISSEAEFALVYEAAKKYMELFDMYHNFK